MHYTVFIIGEFYFYEVLLWLFLFCGFGGWGCAFLEGVFDEIDVYGGLGWVISDDQFLFHINTCIFRVCNRLKRKLLARPNPQTRKQTTIIKTKRKSFPQSPSLLKLLKIINPKHTIVLSTKTSANTGFPFDI